MITKDISWEDKQRLALSRLIQYDWKSSEVKQNILNGDLHQFPILPLDVKLSQQDCLEVCKIFENNNSMTHNVCTTDKLIHLNKNKKLTLYGPNLENYAKFHRSTSTCNSWEELDNDLSDINFYWHYEIEGLKRLVEDLGIKTLYTIEFRTILPNNIERCHTDHENKNLFKGLHNRLYLPISWNSASNLAFYGIGDIKIDVGRVYAFNGNAYMHGARNDHNESIRHALIITCNNNTEKYNELLKISQKKFLSWL